MIAHGNMYMSDFGECSIYRSWREMIAQMVLRQNSSQTSVYYDGNMYMSDFGECSIGAGGR